MSNRKFFGALGPALACIFAFGRSEALASDAWVLSFATLTRHYAGTPECEGIFWQDDQYFFNSNSTPATIHFLGTSNFPLTPNPGEIVIPPNSFHARGLAGLESCADPAVSCDQDVFVVHLDVPDGVFLSSRAEVGDEPTAFCASGTGNPRILAGLPLPVKRALTPGGVAQYQLGIDTGTDDGAPGDSGGASISSRSEVETTVRPEGRRSKDRRPLTPKAMGAPADPFGDNPSGAPASARSSIGIFNAGGVTANATIEVQRGCDDAVLELRRVTIPANSVMQFSGFPTYTSLPIQNSGCGLIPSYSLYAVVTSDQPGFSYAISLRNDMPPLFPGVAPITQ